eukprot:SM000356S13436  [mRNA]  locus=s356:70327:76269:+ [translate_table: standard]
MRRGPAGRRFSPLLLEPGDHYIRDWLASARLAAPAPPPAASWKSRLLRCALSACSLPPWRPRSPQARLTLACSAGRRGRVRLSAKALFFEPDDARAPILRFSFRKVRSIGPKPCGEAREEDARQQHAVVVETTLLVTMKDNGRDVPYTFEKGTSSWWICLTYAPVQELLEEVKELLRYSRLPVHEQDACVKEDAAKREAATIFDTSRLFDLGEHVLLDCPAAKVLPLVRAPGRLVISRARIYFQPMHNLAEDNPVQSQSLVDVLALVRRRHGLQSLGFEIFFSSSSLSTFASSELFIFASEALREQAWRTLAAALQRVGNGASALVLLLEEKGIYLKAVTKLWQDVSLSNLEYLLYLNLAAGRSFRNLSQWPVMPWILADYTSTVLDLSSSSSFRDLSKPIGALNPQRLATFCKRMKEMAEHDPGQQPFLYGTHYSTPCYVLSWLVRSMPEHMLHLQNGRFDAPDRIFGSMADSWQNVLTNSADLKELTPEFFVPPPDHLLEGPDLNLGVRQNGQVVGDVILPPWADGPDDFVAKHALALECDYVSRRLHQWIDLIFGYKQRGEAAEAADNLFHPLTYEGSVCFDTIKDPVQRASRETQVNEFGQTPQQLFAEPHPLRHLFVSHLAAEESWSSDSIIELMQHLQFLLAPLAADTCGRESVVRASQTSTNREPLLRQEHDNTAVSDANTTCSNLDTVEQEHTSLSFADSLPPVQALQSYIDQVTLPPVQALQSYIDQDVGGQAISQREAYLQEQPDDAHSALRSEHRCVESLRRVLRKGVLSGRSVKLHRGALLALSLWSRRASDIAFSTSTDANLKIHSVDTGSQLRATKLGTLPLSSLALARASAGGAVDGDVAAQFPAAALAGSFDGCVYAYNPERGATLGQVVAHDDAVSGLHITSRASVLASCSWDGTVKIWELAEGRTLAWPPVSTSSSARGKSPLSSSAEPTRILGEHEAPILSLDVNDRADLVIAGARDGSVSAWDLRSSAEASAWQATVAHAEITGISLKPDGSLLATASADGSIRILDPRKLQSALATLEGASALRCCKLLGSSVLAGSKNGSSLLWPWNEGDTRALHTAAGPSEVTCMAVPMVQAADSRLCLAVGYGDGTMQTLSDGF